MNPTKKIKPFDIFIAKSNGQYNTTKKHYFICIYTQENDNNNRLSTDIYGIMISSNKKYKKLINNNMNDYNVKISFNKRTSYALCDKLLRVPLDKNVIKTQKLLNYQEISSVKKHLNKFINEVKKQTSKKGELL